MKILEKYEINKTILSRFVSDDTFLHFRIITISLVIIYAQTIFYDFFVFDDDFHQQRIFQINSFLDLLDTKIPIFFSAWKLIAAVDSSAISFRIIITICHIFNALIIYLLSRSFFIKSNVIHSSTWALFVALIFSVHPLQVESIVWVSSFKGVLATFFSLLAIFFYTSDFKSLRVKNLVVYSLYILSVLSKPSNILLPLFFAAYDYFFEYSSFVKILKKNILLIIASIFLGILTILEYPQIAPATKNFNWDERSVYALYSLSFYLKKFFISYPLLFDYGVNPHYFLTQKKTNLFFYKEILAICFLFFSILSLSFFRKLNSMIGFGMAIFLLSILPVIGFIPHNFEVICLVADRFMYLGIFGLSLCVVGVIPVYCIRFINSFKIILSSIVLYLAVFSFFQARLWRSSTSLLSHNLNYQPTSIAALEGLSISLVQDGNLKMAVEIASRGLRQSDSSTFFKTVIYGLMALRNYPALEQFEKLILERFTNIDVNVLAYLDFALFRYDKLTKRKVQAATITDIDKFNYERTSGVIKEKLMLEKKENLKLIEDLVKRYPLERDKEVMEGYFYTAQYFIGLGRCAEFKYFRDKMEAYRKKRSYQGTINLDYDWLKCEKILEVKKPVNASGKKS